MIHRTARRLALGAALASVLSAPPAAAQTPVAESSEPLPVDVETRELAASFATLRARDARVLELGYRLVTGNARFCEDATSTAGLLLHDVRAYGKGEALRSFLGLQGDVGVQALVPGGPAERAGLKIDDTVLAIGPLRVSDIDIEGAEPWQRTETIRAATERMLDENGVLPLTILRDGRPVELTIEGVPACRSRFEVGPGKRAVADGHRIVLGQDFVGIDYPDPLLAGLVAHELAHNLLRHRAWFDAYGKRTRRGVRLTEREADRLSPWLLANAGLDPDGGAKFFKRWGPRHGMWIFRDRDHDAWDERVDNMAAEIPQIESLMASEGAADWPRHFRREKLPSR